jgi:hypothetical protein
MAVVGFNFNKIMVEKKVLKDGKVDINNNVQIKEVETADLSLGKAKQDGVRFVFEFTSKYEPDYASMVLSGDVLFIESEKNVKAILDEWKKKKTVPKETMAEVLNSILNRCNIQAMILARDVNLPSPIPLPKVTVDTMDGKK